MVDFSCGGAPFTRYEVNPSESMIVVHQKKRLVCKKVLLPLLVAIMVLGLPVEEAQAQCSEFPSHPLWGGLNHDRVKSYVKRGLKGDWKSYIHLLEKQLARIGKIINNHKVAHFKHDGQLVTLGGKNLIVYEKASQTRLEIVRCLAVLAGNREPAPLDGIQPQSEDEIRDTEVHATTGAYASHMKLETSTSCSGSVAKFKIKNEGENWPRTSSISIFRIEGANRFPVSSRRMRLKKGQMVSFTVTKSRNPTGHLGLFVDPGWYERLFDYDATLTCH